MISSFLSPVNSGRMTNRPISYSVQSSNRRSEDEFKNSRLRNAEIKYVEKLHEWLTNPENEDLPNEVVEPRIEAAFNEFLQELLQGEDECAEFVSAGNVMHEPDLLPLIFEHFKSRKIYDAIKSNCGVAFSHKIFTESEAMEQRRKEMLSNMEKCLKE